MKYLYIIMILFAPICAYSDAPATSCPSGFVAISENAMTIADTACPAGYVSAGSAETCLGQNTNGVCIIYAPADMEFTDDAGAYIYTNVCPLE